jgi:rare lipoprotein A
MAMARRHFLGPGLWLAATLLVGSLAGGCAGMHPRLPEARPEPFAVQTGYASFYARAHHGRRTASGERFNMRAMTAAHRSLPFGTRVRVVNLENGREAVVRINDRGPRKHERIIDLSYAAARKLGFVRQGTTRVRVEVL